MNFHRTLVLIFSLLLSLTTCVFANTIDTLEISFKCDTLSRAAKVRSVYSIASHISIPRFVVDKKGQQYEVDLLGYMAFSKVQTKDLYLVLPNSISTIASGSFYKSKEIQTLSIDGNVNQIADRAFASCVSLKNVNIKPVHSIGEYAFAMCKELTDLSFLSCVKEIGGFAFYKCINIESFDMPNSLCELGRASFAHCINLKRIRFSESLSIIRRDAFKNCTSLTEIFLPGNVKRVCSNAFADCSNLSKVKLSKNTIVEKCAFPENTVFEYY